MNGITVEELEQARIALNNKADRAYAKANEIAKIIVESDVTEGELKFELPRHIEKYILNRRKMAGNTED
jgi:hypothetical protein